MEEVRIIQGKAVSYPICWVKQAGALERPLLEINRKAKRWVCMVYSIFIRIIIVPIFAKELDCGLCMYSITMQSNNCIVQSDRLEVKLFVLISALN